MKICPIGAELFHAVGRKDRRTDRQADSLKERRDELNSRFSKFCERV